MVHLHLHSALGSKLDGVSSSFDYVKKAQQLNHSAIATTDHGHLSNLWQHQQACLKGGIKPILGVEMYIAPELVHLVDDKRKRTKDQHIILLVQNKTGYKNLLRLNYMSMSDDTHFYYSPRITSQELFEHSEGLLCGTACFGSPFSQLLRAGNDTEADDLFTQYLDVFKDRFYAEVQINELIGPIDRYEEGQKSYNNWIINKAKEHGVPVVLTGDVHYAEKGQDKLQTLSIAIRDKSTIDKITFELESKNLFYLNETDFLKFNDDFGYGYPESLVHSWLNNTDFIASKVDFKIPERTKMILPNISDDDELLLIQKSKEGLSNYFKKPFDECPIEYRKRLGTELSVIIRKGFCNYLLILEDIFRFAKEKEISHGPGRGSASGSLVVFCLGITTIDPIKFGLLFERFLNQTRSVDAVYSYFEEDI